MTTLRLVLPFFSPTEAKRRSLILSNAASAHTANEAKVLTEIRAPLPTLTEQETETEQRLSSREDRDRSWQRGERKERGGDGWGRLDSGETKRRRWDGCGRGGGSCSDVGQPYANRSIALSKSGGLAASAEE